MRFFFLNVLWKEVKHPLGRWHNTGQYYDEKFLKLKEAQKEKREVIRKYDIDPYYSYVVPLQKKYGVDPYSLYEKITGAGCSRP